MMLQEEERDPDLAFRDIAKFGILQIAGLFHVVFITCEMVHYYECAVDTTLTLIQLASMTDALNHAITASAAAATSSQLSSSSQLVFNYFSVVSVVSLVPCKILPLVALP